MSKKNNVIKKLFRKLKCLFGFHENVVIKEGLQWDWQTIKCCIHCDHTEYFLFEEWLKIERNDFTNEILRKHLEKISHKRPV